MALRRAEREKIVATPPPEGRLEYQKHGWPINCLASEATKLANEPFQGKHPPLPEDQEIIILLGAQGCGKSYWAREEFNALAKAKKDETMFVSYDEEGAIFSIPEYLKYLCLHTNYDPYYDEHVPVSKDDLEMRRELWEVYQPLSQYIRSRVLVRTLIDGLSAIIDTTSSNTGTLKFIDLLHRLEVPKITMKGYFAPFPISRERVECRVRPETEEAFITKRIGVLEMIPELFDKPDRFEYYYNPENGKKPVRAFVVERGKTIESDLTVIEKVMQDIIEDARHVAAYIEETKELQKPGSYERYVAAANKTLAFLHGQFAPQQPAPILVPA